MAISSLNRSSFSNPISSTSSTERVSPAAQSVESLPEVQPQNDLRQLFMADSFEAGPSQVGGAAGGAQAGTAEGPAAMMNQMAQMLGQIMQLLQAMGSQMKGNPGGASGEGQQGQTAPVGGAGAARGTAPSTPSAPTEQAAAAPAAAAPAAPAPAAAAAPAQAPAPAAAPSADVSKSQASAPAANKSTSPGNSMSFTNDGKTPMTLKFTPNAGGQDVQSITLKPGESRNVDFPQGWSGNFRSDKGDGTAATLGEVKFDGGSDGKTFYDVSYIEGNNAAMTIAPENGGKTSGTLDNLLANAPDSIKAKDASGQAYGIKKSTTSNVQDASVVDYYRQKVGSGDGYVIPTDDASTLGTNDKHLSVHLSND
jgi:hypothetical protein